MAIVWAILILVFFAILSLGIVIGLLISPAIAKVIRYNKEND